MGPLRAMWAWLALLSMRMARQRPEDSMIDLIYTLLYYPLRRTAELLNRLAAQIDNATKGKDDDETL